MRARLREVEQLRGEPGGMERFWSSPGRARRFQAMVAKVAGRDPLFRRLRQAARRDTVVLDVGAGTGRLAVPLAPHVREVVAVDASAAMLAVLRREARRRGIANITCVEGRWQDVAVPPADLAVCSHVLPLIEDAAGFLAKIDAACTGRAFVYVNAGSFDAHLDPFWRHFHGGPRRPAPTYLDLVGILRELGLKPEVEVVEVPTLSRFSSLAAAVRSYRDTLLLADTPEVRRELRALLRPWLVEDRGELRPPVRSTAAAIVSWV